MTKLPCILLAAVPALAHDMWIEPTTFAPQVGQIVGLKLRVGQELIGDLLPRDPSLVKDFVVLDSAGARKPVVGRDGASPAGYLRVAAPGMHVVGYASNPSSVEQEAEQFNKYLKEEGLSVPPIRAGTRSREMFLRCAKSLVLSGPPSAAQGDRSLGFALELVAERNPYLLGAGDELPIRLTYEGKPLAGALVVAMNRRSPADKVSARTGADGRVKFRLAPGGMWMVKAVHMVPAPKGAGAEWMSYWASVTFQPQAPAVKSD
jgi:uncharacterized GH25 family protein